jgi:hypothetical protein
MKFNFGSIFRRPYRIETRLILAILLIGIGAQLH